MSSPSPSTENRILLENTYLVEFASDASNTDCFQRVTKSLQTSHRIQSSRIKKRCEIRSSLFNGVSFTITGNYSLEAIEMIKDVVAIYPVYDIHVPRPKIDPVSPKSIKDNGNGDFRSYDLTGVSQVHKDFQNFGKGVKVRRGLSTDIFHCFFCRWSIFPSLSH
jgi:hypothetical protein